MPFQLTFDGVVFGLITECHGEDDSAVMEGYFEVGGGREENALTGAV